MNNYGKFFVDFLTPFFEGLVSIFKSIFTGIIDMLNIVEYYETIKNYQESVNVVFIIIAVICLVLLLALFGGFNGSGNGFGNGFGNDYAWLSNGQKDIMTNTNICIYSLI